MNVNSGNIDIERKHSTASNPSTSSNTEFGRNHSMRVNESEISSNGSKVVLPPLSQQIQNLQSSTHLLSQPLLKNGSNLSTYRYMPNNNISPTTPEGQVFNFLLNKQNKNQHLYPQQQQQKILQQQDVPDDALEAAKLVVNFSNNQQPLSSNGSIVSNNNNSNNYLPSVFQKQNHLINQQNNFSSADLSGSSIPMALQQNQPFPLSNNNNNISQMPGKTATNIGPILTPLENVIPQQQQIAPALLNEQEFIVNNSNNGNNIINGEEKNLRENSNGSIFLNNSIHEKKRGKEERYKVTKSRKKEVCTVCNQSFSNLRTHMASHLDAKARPFKCAFCFRGFARNNDLQRHQKKHLLERNLTESSRGSVAASEELMNILNARNSKKKTGSNVCATPLGFQCPFYSNNDDEIGYPDDEDYVPNRCHSTGIFTRCDTFKNHLKALHFRYPKGTSRKNRPNVDGYCKHCSIKFPNCKNWVDQHVLTGSCLKNKPFKSYMVPKNNNNVIETTPASENTNNITSISSNNNNHNTTEQVELAKNESRDIEENLSQSIPLKPPTTANILDLNNL